jgi:hypothetical protein
MLTKVFVYRNLTKKCWSVRDVKTKKVIEHRETLTLLDCTFKVSEAGRQRVLRTKQKNVHAGVEGYLCDIVPVHAGVQVYYNPYKQSTFTIKDTPIYNANVVKFFTEGLVTVNIKK